MSCDAAALAFSLHLAALHAEVQAPPLWRIASASPPAVSALSREPLFASIVKSAGRLRDEVDALRRAPSPDAARLAAVDAQVQALSGLDMQGHLELAKRGTDGDLKCILRGISQDLPRKWAAVTASSAPAGRRSALDELWYLLRDNVEVVTTPAGATSTDTAA